MAGFSVTPVGLPRYRDGFDVTLRQISTALFKASDRKMADKTMITKDDLLKGEHETLEFMQDIPKEKEKYIKTAVAFANSSGGRLIFGVENNTWNVVGFSDDEVFQKYDIIANSIFDACEPSIVPILSIEELSGKRIIVADIMPGMSRATVQRTISEMKKAGILSRAGSNNGGSWIIH